MKVAVLPSTPQARPIEDSVTEALAAVSESRWRRRLGRGFRLFLAGGIGLSAAQWARQSLTEVKSEQAFINASVMPMRAQIPGQLCMGSLEPGSVAVSGQEVFRIENPRFGNVEAMTQLNWIQELVERLRAELTEAELRYAKQLEIFRHHESLFGQKLIARLEYVEEERKVVLCQAALESTKRQTRAAEVRQQEVERHLDLQRHAAATIPFDGVIWSVHTHPGSQVAAHELVLQIINPKRIWVDAFIKEKHADRFQVGTPVLIHTADGKESWRGRVDSIRAGVGRVDVESPVALPPGDLARRRLAVRISMDSLPPFSAGQFYGVGRSVIVSLPPHE